MRANLPARGFVREIFPTSHFLIGHYHIILSEARTISQRVISTDNKAVGQLPQGWVPAGYLSGNAEPSQSVQTALASSHTGSLTVIYKKIETYHQNDA